MNCSGRYRFRLPGYVGLDLAIFKYCLDDQLTTLEIRIVRRRSYPLQNVSSFVRIHLSTVYAFLQQATRIVLTLLRIGD